MGRSYRKVKRWNADPASSKKHRRRERRRIRTRNRKVKTEMEFVTKVQKNWPRVLENYSTVGNIESCDDVVYIVECVIRDLGPDFGYKDISKKDMDLEEQMDLATTILAQGILMMKDYGMCNSLVPVMKYIKDSKKQLSRRGAFAPFRGHSHTKDLLPMIQEGEPRGEEEEVVVPKVVRTRPSLPNKLRMQVQESRIPDPPPLPSASELVSHATYKVKVAQSTQSTPTLKVVENKEGPNDDSWACTIM